MKGNGKRILSLCLAAVVTVTTVGYAPPFTSSASWKSNMEKALELLASPTEAFKQVSTATPSEAESPSIEATSSEAQIPDGKATPSEAVKKFVRVEPEEIPEYYSQSSASGKRLWKFEDRYGMMQYRDYGYVQGEAEFPLWYVTDLTGKVDDTSDSANLDEEYYNLAPYVYKSVAPDQIAWANLSWRLLSDIDEINSYTRKKVSGFKNWNTSGYDIWHLVNKGDEEEDLGYHFFGIIINEEEGEREKEPGWYYSDENGNINNQAKLLLTAQFELSSPILTLDGNGGSFSDKTSMTLEVKAGDSLDQLLTDAKSQIIRKYYTFDGWYTASTGGIKYTESGNIMPTSDLTLYARWVKSSCEVIFKDWDGTVLEVQEVPIGGDAVNHIPERPNYEFMGWNRSLTNIKYDTTITAKYTLISDLDGFTVFFSRYGFDKYTKYVESIPGEHYAKVAYLHRKKLPWKNNNFYYLDTDYYNTSRYVSEIDFPKLESDDNNYLIGWTLVPGRADSYKNNGRGLYWYQPNYTLYHGQLETDESEIVFGFPLFQRRDNVKVREYMGLTSWNSTVEENNNGFGAVQTTALYLPKDKASLVLVNGIKDFHSTFHVLYENYWDKTNIGETNFTTVFQEDTPFIESISVEDFGSKVNIYSSTKYPNQRIYQGKDGIEEILSYKETDTTGTRGRSWYTTHKLIGYYSEPNGAGKELLGNYTFNKVDDRYYAYWVSKDAEFYVTFKDENGAVLGSETVTAGDPCKNVPVGTAKPGYKFIGWQPVDSDNNSTTNKVTRDTTFIAAYEKLATYQLILDGNGGTLEGNPQKEVEVAFEQSFDQVLKDGKDVVTRPGYCFDGWYTSESGGAIYSYSGNQMPSINVTVYAHWTPNTYKVTFDPDHKKWTKGVFKEEYTYDTELGILPTPDIYGLNFDGWWSGKNGTGIKITQHSMVESKDSVYYGNWSAVKYVVRFLSRVEQPEGESIQTFTVDQAYEEAFQTLPEPVERGYTFAGWYDEENKNISAQSIFRPEHLAEEYTYHARWKGNQYIIQFISNDVNGTPIVTELIQEYPSRFGTLPTPEKTGYSFAGWFDENGNEVEKGSWIDADDRIYKAKWIANQYTIHFVRNLPESGIMEEPEDKTVTYALPIGALPNLNETGYVFLGWFTEPEGGTRIKETTLAALGDQTYYGHWTIGIIDNGNGTYRKPGADGTWNTTDDELWWKGLDGISLTSDDKRILTFVNRTGTYADNENGTHYRPGTGESWTSGIELWWNGPDGIPGTDDDVRIYARGNGNSGTPIYYIDSGNGIYIRPGADGNWGSGTQYWWFGPDGTSGTDDDRQIHVLPGGGYYIDNGDGTYIRPGTGGSWTSGTEHWWYGPDGTPGTSDDRQIHVLPGVGYYIDNGDGTYIRPGTGGSWTSGTEHWWYGPDGTPGTSDDRQIHVMPGGGYYIDNGDGTYIKPGTGGSWTSGTEHWWYGADGKPGTSDDRQIHVLPGGGYYIDNGDGTYIRPGTGGSWTSGTEHWWYGPDGTPGTSDDRQIHVLPGGGYYIDNGDGTYIKPGTGGSWTSGTEHWWYGPDGKPGTDDDRPIHVLPGGGYYIDNGDGTHIRPGTGGSWDHGTEIWLNGPDGKPGTPDDYKKVDNGNTDPEPTKPEPTDPEPTKPDPTDPEPTKPEPTDPEPTKPEPTKPDPVKPEPSNPSKPETSNESKAKDNESATVPEIPSIDSASKPSVRNDGGTFHVNPENPKDVTYIKPDGTPASNEWVGDGTNLYHVDEESKLNYSWFLERDNTWFMLNNDSGEQFGAALRGWYSESMDKKKYFFDPSTTKMLTGWQRIDGKSYYFTEKNERKTYTGDNRIGWLFDNEILHTPLSLLDRPYGSMYRNEYTPDGYWVDENGVCADKK